MFAPNYHQLTTELSNKDPFKQSAARMILLALHEEAINPLGDIFYDGVTDEQGIAILELVAEIGGLDAMAMLRNVMDFESDRPTLQVCAAKGLLENRHYLNGRELRRVLRFLDQNRYRAS